MVRRSSTFGDLKKPTTGKRGPTFEKEWIHLPVGTLTWLKGDFSHLLHCIQIEANFILKLSSSQTQDIWQGICNKMIIALGVAS